MALGRSPLPNTPNSSAEAPREPLDKVYACIEEDLDKAYKELPDRNSNVSGRVNKWTAGSYLLKMYTYLASCKENRVGQELGSPINSFDWVDAEACWKKAAAIAEDIYATAAISSSGPTITIFWPTPKAVRRRNA